MRQFVDISALLIANLPYRSESSLLLQIFSYLFPSSSAMPAFSAKKGRCSGGHLRQTLPVGAPVGAGSSGISTFSSFFICPYAYMPIYAHHSLLFRFRLLIMMTEPHPPPETSSSISDNAHLKQGNYIPVSSLRQEAQTGSDYR